MSPVEELEQKKAQVKQARKKVEFFGSQVVKGLTVSLAMLLFFQNKSNAQQNAPETDFSKNRLELFFNDSTIQNASTLERLAAYKKAYIAEFNRRAYLFMREKMLELKTANNDGKKRNRAKIKEICGADTKDITRYCMQFCTKMLEQVDKEMAQEYGASPVYGKMKEWMKSPQSCSGVDNDLRKEFAKNNIPVGKSLEQYFAQLEELGIRGPVIGVNKIRHVNKKTGAVSYSNHAVTYFAFKDEKGELQLKWISANRESENSNGHRHPYALFTYCGTSNQENLTYAYTKSMRVYESAMSDNSLYAQAREPEPVQIDVSGTAVNYVKPLNSEELPTSVAPSTSEQSVPDPTLQKLPKTQDTPNKQLRKTITRRL